MSCSTLVEQDCMCNIQRVEGPTSLVATAEWRGAQKTRRQEDRECVRGLRQEGFILDLQVAVAIIVRASAQGFLRDGEDGCCVWCVAATAAAATQVHTMMVKNPHLDVLSFLFNSTCVVCVCLQYELNGRILAAQKERASLAGFYSPPLKGNCSMTSSYSCSTNAPLSTWLVYNIPKDGSTLKLPLADLQNTTYDDGPKGSSFRKMSMGELSV